MKIKNFSFKYSLIFVLLISFTEISISRKWSVEDLVQNVKEWNYLNDPEDLITD